MNNSNRSFKRKTGISRILSICLLMFGLVSLSFNSLASEKSTSPVFKGISEIIMVVEDVDKSIKQQWELFGIGPWEIWTFDPSSVSDMVVHDKPMDFAIKVAYTKIGETYWELVQPLDKKSTYYEVLKTRGEGVHNIVFEVDDYQSTIRHMKDIGVGVYNSGDWQGVKFLNFDTRKVLPVIAEIFELEEGAKFPPAESTYP